MMLANAIKDGLGGGRALAVFEASVHSMLSALLFCKSECPFRLLDVVLNHYGARTTGNNLRLYGATSQTNNQKYSNVFHRNLLGG